MGTDCFFFHFFSHRTMFSVSLERREPEYPRCRPIFPGDLRSDNQTEEESDTTVHQIYGQRATLSVNYKPGDWDTVHELG